ncbi:MAG TPA: hypothetical protein VMO26_29430 [Vicinamibacterales bacterium]|nr:hypothetical protein [Vicinamibacterales bacterium]
MRCRPDVAVHGDAMSDPDFGVGDIVRYSVDVSRAQGPFTVDAQLWYQPIAYRWADNLRTYDAFEPQRFVRNSTRLPPRSRLTIFARF